MACLLFELDVIAKASHPSAGSPFFYHFHPNFDGLRPNSYLHGLPCHSHVTTADSFAGNSADTDAFFRTVAETLAPSTSSAFQSS